MQRVGFIILAVFVTASVLLRDYSYDYPLFAQIGTDSGGGGNPPGTGGGGGSSNPGVTATASPAPTSQSTPTPTPPPTIAPSTSSTPPPASSTPPPASSTPPPRTPTPPPRRTPIPPGSGVVTPTPSVSASPSAIPSSTPISTPIPKPTLPIIPTIKKVSSPVSVATSAGVAVSAVASAVSVATSGASLLTYLEFFLKNVLIFLGLKKKARTWGTIYDSATKQPLPYTKIQLLGKDFRILETRITDREGRYGFLQSASQLQVRPVRENFRFPSLAPSDSAETLLYPHAYRGGVVTIAPDELVTFDVPMDPLLPHAATSKLKLPHAQLHNFWAILSGVFFWVALIAVPLNYLLYPTRVNLVMLIVFVALNLFIVAGDLRQRPYGLVIDRDAKTPVPYSLITLNSAYGERRGFTVSDEQGRYFLLSDKGKFTINAFTPAQVHPPRTSEETLVTDRGWIAKQLRL